MKVLVIDDDADIRTIVRLSLSHLGGMDVVEAAGGAEGVRKARDEHPDVILLDVMMPVMDGPATLELLRSQAQTTATPVIYLTAKILSAELERLKGRGAAGLLTKPFDPRTLPADVRAILDARLDL